jgi:RNA polymerase subunit RPABC4/transcription elongation factor Spt4
MILDRRGTDVNMKRCQACGKTIHSKEHNYCRKCVTKGLARYVQDQRIKRACLKCDREFLAIGRFNRICPSCHESNRGLDIPSFKIASPWPQIG